MNRERLILVCPAFYKRHDSAIYKSMYIDKYLTGGKADDSIALRFHFFSLPPSPSLEWMTFQFIIVFGTC